MTADTLHNMCIVSYFGNRLKLKTLLRTDRRKVFNQIFKYLLGLQNYGTTFKELKEYGVHYSFSEALREIRPSFVTHVFTNFRRHAKQLSKWTLPKNLNGIHKTDAKHLRTQFPHINYEDIHKTDKFPTENDVVESFKKTIIKMSYKIYENLHNDNSLAKEDIQSELYYKLIEAYRLYVFNIGTDNFNLSVFYSCLHRALNSRRIDFQASTFKEKRIINSVVSTSLDAMENTDLCHSFTYHGSPEDILIAKQTMQEHKDKMFMQQYVG